MASYSRNEEIYIAQLLNEISKLAIRDKGLQGRYRIVLKAKIRSDVVTSERDKLPEKDVIFGSLSYCEDLSRDGEANRHMQPVKESTTNELTTGYQHEPRQHSRKQR
ncbi:hypothetical protein G163CM_12920 [Pseudocitrobacter corydidari]|uniref:Uncharacterized protein n=1 Tax=Pseudocitrobacter corydidari TaxID=2891570 RepID=A0ABY3S3F4_9ENTR|nr:hypothetical protein G163CM_12920 [Pseudocitrobacter corydidari]